MEHRFAGSEQKKNMEDGDEIEQPLNDDSTPKDYSSSQSQFSGFQINDPVSVYWNGAGKVPWPGKVVEDPAISGLKNPSKSGNRGTYHCIYFFGAHNYQWILDAKLLPYTVIQGEPKMSKSMKLGHAEMHIYLKSQKK